MKNSTTHLWVLTVAFVFVAGSLMAMPPPPAPDASSTCGLLGVAVAGLFAAKRFIKR